MNKPKEERYIRTVRNKTFKVQQKHVKNLRKFILFPSASVNIYLSSKYKTLIHNSCSKTIILTNGMHNKYYFLSMSVHRLRLDNSYLRFIVYHSAF